MQRTSCSRIVLAELLFKSKSTLVSCEMLQKSNPDWTGLTGHDESSEQNPHGGNEGTKSQHEAKEEPHSGACKQRHNKAWAVSESTQRSSPGVCALIRGGTGSLHTCLSHAAFTVAVASHLAIWNSIYPGGKTEAAESVTKWIQQKN